MTHQIIKIICYADDKKEARKKAELILHDYLVGDSKPFDYGVFFDEEGGSIAGKSRWGNLPVVTLANSKEGKKLIDEGMKNTKDEFMGYLKDVREMINFYSDEELYGGEIKDTKKKIIKELEDKEDTSNLHLFKYYCNCVGQYRGSNIFVYDNDGEGIRTNEHLKSVLNMWNEKDNRKVFVLPIDVHS